MIKRAVIFARVSTGEQDFTYQVRELTKVASQKEWNIVDTIGETVSGGAKLSERKGIHQLLNYVESEKIDVVMVTEFTRLSRNPDLGNSVLLKLAEKKISLYIHSYGIETMQENSITGEIERNPTAMILFTILNEFAHANLNEIRRSVKLGLKNAVAKGKKLGRPKNSGMDNTKFLEKHSDVVKQLGRGIPIRNVAKICSKSKFTVEKVKSALSRKQLSAT